MNNFTNKKKVKVSQKHVRTHVRQRLTIYGKLIQSAYTRLGT